MLSTPTFRLGLELADFPGGAMRPSRGANDFLEPQASEVGIGTMRSTRGSK